MHTTPLYEDRAAYVTAQVVDASEGDDFSLEAFLQFVNGNSAVVYDFSNYLLPSDSQEQNEQHLSRLLAEVEAVNAIHDHVSRFKSAFLEAASVGIERLAPKAGM